MPSHNSERAMADAIEHQNAILKFISPNDVGITGGHQCGFYLPKQRWKMFSPFAPQKGKNYDHFVKILWQDGRLTDSCVKWYGNRTRSEYRLTRFGRDFPYLTADSVGNLLVLIRIDTKSFHAYVLDLPDDIEDIQAALGVEVIESWGAYDSRIKEPEITEDECIKHQFENFIVQLHAFPGTEVFSDITRKAILKCLSAFPRQPLDNRLLILMEKEYSLFRMAERTLCQHEITRMFKSVDDFLSTASRIMNRRKSRAGRALENHVGYLFKESSIPFDVRANVDGKPDILIPGAAEYRDRNWPVNKLCALGIKTTCKDRWRQVLNEAKRIPEKHILTIQQGISANQLSEMHQAKVTLVVPSPLHKLYPKVTGMNLITIDDFVANVKKMLN